MTVAEFFGCAFLAFGPAAAMFCFTIAHDPMRIIILLTASFFWLISLLLSSLIWFAVVPLREKLIFSVFFSVLIQELFRYGIYLTLRKAERGLREVADNITVMSKHMLAYVSGLGFGITSGAFALVNILADAAGPATMGLKGGSENFFLSSAAHTQCMILLNVFWSVIFFNGCDKRKYEQIIFVTVSHLFVSCMTLWNSSGDGWYAFTLVLSILMSVLCATIAFKIAGGSTKTLKRFVRCQ